MKFGIFSCYDLSRFWEWVKAVMPTYPFCPSLTTLSSSPSLVLIHLTPCNCGSIISGHRSQLVSIVAFSVLMRSLGRFSLFHPAMVALSVNKVSGSRPSVILIGTWNININKNKSKFRDLFKKRPHHPGCKVNFNRPSESYLQNVCLNCKFYF